MAVETEELSGGGRRNAIRRYPPLVLFLSALLIALAVLPSALTLPQANPQAVFEIVPAPPNKQQNTPNANFSDLGLGSSGNLESGGAVGGNNPGAGLPPPPSVGPEAPPPPSIPRGQGKTKQSKRCVSQGGELKQTEDPLTPPCVSEFSGDNGGATYQGVSDSEIRIVVYLDGGLVISPTPRGTDNTPTNKLVDLDDDPQTNETGDLTTLRSWQKYFNDRYQTYDRRAHLWVYYSGGGASRSQQQRQADAAQAYNLVHPFAVVSFAQFGGSADGFLIYMAQHGVLNFGSVTFRPASFFQQFPKLIWGYPPSIEQEAKNFVDFFCSRVAPYPSSFAGTNQGADMNNKPRKYGMIYTDDPAYPNLRAFHTAVEKGLKDQCNVVPEVSGTYHPNGFAIDGSGNVPQYAIDNMTKMQSSGVTTIIWPGGSEPNQSSYASKLQYFPEWIIAGDGQSDATSYAINQDPQEWAHVWVATTAVNIQGLTTQPCYVAYRTVDTITQDSDVQNFACPFYNDLRQLFTGIQVAGPKLGPTSVDRGFHAIPSVDSTDNRVPACFYEASDYTCVKDLLIEWWDTQGQTTTWNNPGCWRETNSGRRTIAGRWDKEDVIKMKQVGVDICNNNDVNYNVNTP